MQQQPKVNYVSNAFARTPAGVELTNKNPHAVALGKMTSPDKAKASATNGQKGGRPAGS